MSRERVRLFEIELAGKPAYEYLKVSWLDDWFIVSANEGKIIRAQLEHQGAALPGFEINLRKTFEPLSRRRERGNEIANVDQRDFLAGPTTGVGDFNADRQLIIAGDCFFTQLQIAVSKGRVTQTLTEFELRFESHVPESRIFGLESFVIVGD